MCHDKIRCVSYLYNGSCPYSSQGAIFSEGYLRNWLSSEVSGFFGIMLCLLRNDYVIFSWFPVRNHGPEFGPFYSSKNLSHTIQHKVIWGLILITSMHNTSWVSSSLSGLRILQWDEMICNAWVSTESSRPTHCPPSDKSTCIWVSSDIKIRHFQCQIKGKLILLGLFNYKRWGGGTGKIFRPTTRFTFEHPLPISKASQPPPPMRRRLGPHLLLFSNRRPPLPPVFFSFTPLPTFLME